MSSAEQAPLQYAEPREPLPPGYHLPTVETVRYWRHLLTLGIVSPGHRAHRRKAIDIPDDAIQTDDTRRVVENLQRIADAIKTGDPRKGIEGQGGLVGLAATQAGVSAPIALVDISKTVEPTSDQERGTLTVMIKPTVTVHEGSKQKGVGHKCYSLPGIGAYPVLPTDVTVSWFDLQAVHHEQELHGEGGIVVAHEVGHLERTFFTRMAEQQDLPVYAVSREEERDFFRGEAGGLAVYGEVQLEALLTDQFQPEKLVLPGDPVG